MVATAKIIMTLAVIVLSVGNSKRQRNACSRQFRFRGRLLHDLEMQLNLAYDCFLGEFAEIADPQPEVFYNYTKGSKLIAHTAYFKGKQELLDNFKVFVNEAPCDSFGCFLNKRRRRVTCVFTAQSGNNYNSEDHERPKTIEQLTQKTNRFLAMLINNSPLRRALHADYAVLMSSSFLTVFALKYTE